MVTQRNIEEKALIFACKKSLEDEDCQKLGRIAK